MSILDCVVLFKNPEFSFLEAKYDFFFISYTGMYILSIGVLRFEFTTCTYIN